MHSSEVANNLFSALDVIVDKKLSQLAFDITIIAEVIELPQTSEPKYLLQYQDSMFYASLMYQPNFDLRIGDRVYVLVPQASFKNEKFILGPISLNWRPVDMVN